jgi:hypothetical protein
MTLIFLAPNQNGLLFMADKRSMSNGQTYSEDRSKLLKRGANTVAFSTELTRIVDSDDPSVVIFDSQNLLSSSPLLELPLDLNRLKELAEQQSKQLRIAFSQIPKTDTVPWKPAQIILQTFIVQYIDTDGKYSGWHLRIRSAENLSIVTDFAPIDSIFFTSCNPNAFGRSEAIIEVKNAGVFVTPDPVLAPFFSEHRPATSLDEDDARKCCAKLAEMTIEHLESLGVPVNVGSVFDQILLSPNGIKQYPPAELNQLLT